LFLFKKLLRIRIELMIFRVRHGMRESVGQIKYGQ